MAKEIQYEAHTGIATVSIANPEISGTGSMESLISAADNGTLIKTITVKAIADTTPGMVRIFAVGANTRLIEEIEIPAITKSSRDPAFQKTVHLDYFIMTGGSLKASTEKGETFQVIAEGLDFSYYASVRPESTRYTAKNGFATLTTANTALDGTGTIGTDMWEVITGAAYGMIIQSITIKAQVSTTPGMVRLFLYNSVAGINFLFKEIPVPAVTKSATAHSFSHRIDFGGKDFALNADWKIRATTEKSEAINVIAEGFEWTYPA